MFYLLKIFIKNKKLVKCKQCFENNLIILKSKICLNLKNKLHISQKN